MTKSRYVGESVRRVEDERLLKGQTMFIADINRPNQAHAVVVRSTEPNAILKSINYQEAAKLEGFVAVYTAKDIADRIHDLTKRFYQLTPDFIAHANVVESDYVEPILANKHVTHVGQPVAVVIAESRRDAEEIRDLIEVEYENLPAVSNAMDALSEDSPKVHPGRITNIDASFNLEIGNVTDAERSADFVIEREFYFGRSTGSPMENRGVVADWDEGASHMTVWSTSQIPYILKANIQESLSIDSADLDVLVPDMGGSFGGGIYPEEIIIPFVAKELNRPIQWLEDRGESIMNSRHSRDHRIKVRAHFFNDGKLLGLDVRVVQDTGSTNPFGITLIHNVATHIRSVYDIRNFRIEGLAVSTNKTRNTPVRGAGRPEATFVIDRVLDIAAKVVGIDPAQIRERNMIEPSQMPYSLEMLYRDGVPAVYESGGFTEQFSRLLELSNYGHWRNVQKLKRSEGRFIGIGLSCHVEATGIGPMERLKIVARKNGIFEVFIGAQPHGQSHHTVISQIVADELSVDIKYIDVKSGDTRFLSSGSGTFGSRSAVVTGSVAHIASKSLKFRIKEIASNLLEVDYNDVRFLNGMISVEGVPKTSMTIAELIEKSFEKQSDGMIEEFDQGISVTESFCPPTVVYGSGAHCAVVEIDPSTYGIEILDYISVDDCGAMINPKVVDGQVYGGVVHGLSNALLEEVVYDENGYCTNPNLMGYLVASATESPRITALHIDHPTKLNPLGVKGVGEGATSSAPAAIANAISDAFEMFSVEINKVPIKPWDIYNLILSKQSKGDK